jgi:hypothetical protein
MNLTLEKVEPIPENGKRIADFLSEHFWAEHSLSGEGSPPIDWSRASSHINHFLFERYCV